MLWLSEILLQNQQLESFQMLIQKVREYAGHGERFFRMDICPPYPDTPPNWEDQLEAAFTRALTNADTPHHE
jgi:hypothetical protein